MNAIYSQIASYKALRRDEKFQMIYYYLTLLFAFTMPLSRAAISFFLILFPLIWIIEGDFKRKWSEIKESKFLVVFMVFLILVIISGLFFSDDGKLAFRHIRLYLYWFSIFVLATSLKKEWIRTILSAFLCGMIVSEVIAYGVFFELWQWKNITKANPSPFMIHIEYSVYLAFTSILLFNRVLSKNYSLPQKLFFTLFFLSTTGNLFLQTGRTGQVAYVAALVVMFFLHYKFSLKAFIGIFLSATVIYLSAYNISHNFNKRVHQTIEEITTIQSGELNTSWGIRLAFWPVAYEIVKEHPIFGVGIGDFQKEAANVLTKDKFDSFHPYVKEFISTNNFHNQFLQCSVGMGLIGLFICIALYFLAFKTAICTKDRELRDIYLLFMVIYTIGSFSDTFWGAQFSVTIWILLTSLMLVSNKKLEHHQSLDK